MSINRLVLVDDLKTDSNNLFEAVGIVAGGGITTTVFDPFEKGFDVLVSEVADENFVYSEEKNLSDSLGGEIVLVEEYEGGVKRIARFGDLGSSGVGWDDGNRAGVGGHDEGGERQGVVNGG